MFHPTEWPKLVKTNPKEAKKKIREALKASETLPKAAESLGLERTSLWRYMRKLRITAKPSGTAAAEPVP